MPKTNKIRVVIFSEVKEEIVKHDAMMGRFVFYSPSNTPKHKFSHYITVDCQLTWEQESGTVKLDILPTSFILDGSEQMYSEKAHRLAEQKLLQEEFEPVETIEELEDFLYEIGCEEASIHETIEEFAG